MPERPKNQVQEFKSDHITSLLTSDYKSQTEQGPSGGILTRGTDKQRSNAQILSDNNKVKDGRSNSANKKSQLFKNGN